MMIHPVDTNRTIKNNIAAIILSAGYSSRMSALKPLYPVGDELMIGQAIRTFHDSGIKDIIVVTGWKRELLGRFLHERYPLVQTVVNKNYDAGMFSSVLAGMSSLLAETEGFILLPVDYPFVRLATIHKLITAFIDTDADIISPLYHGIAGHPPVIRHTVFNSIYQSDGAGGLRAVLAQPDFSTFGLETDDEGIFDDVDDDAAYIRLMNKYLNIEHRYPVSDEIEKLWEKFELPPLLITHMKKVRETAVGICEELNASGEKLNPGLLSAACLLHDLCRNVHNHPAAASRFMTELGYPEIADIVSQHMEIDFTVGSEIDEAALLYLADKMVQEDRIVNLEHRMNAKIEKFKDSPDAVKNIRRRFNKAFLIQCRINDILE